ncbi:type II secretion system protein, partial [Clostridium perfringens]
IYKFLEKSSQNLENQPQKEKEKHIY